MRAHSARNMDITPAILMAAILSAASQDTAEVWLPDGSAFLLRRDHEDERRELSHPVGDLDGDGVDDLAFPHSGVGVPPDLRRILLLSGADGSYLGEIDAADVGLDPCTVIFASALATQPLPGAAALIAIGCPAAPGSGRGVLCVGELRLLQDNLDWDCLPAPNSWIDGELRRTFGSGVAFIPYESAARYRVLVSAPGKAFDSSGRLHVVDSGGARQDVETSAIVELVGPNAILGMDLGRAGEGVCRLLCSVESGAGVAPIVVECAYGSLGLEARAIQHEGPAETASGELRLIPTRGDACRLYRRPYDLVNESLVTASPLFRAPGQSDRFGSALAFADEGEQEWSLAVGSYGDPQGKSRSLGSQFGAIWLTKWSEGTDTEVVAKIGAGPRLDLGSHDWFGYSVVAGDLNGDDVTDVLVGAPLDDTAGENVGVVWAILLTRDGEVSQARRIVPDRGSLGRQLNPDSWFGSSVAILGSRAGGPTRIAIGAARDDLGGDDTGSVFLLSLDRDLDQSLLEVLPVPTAVEGIGLLPCSFFGASMSATEDGAVLAVGAPGDPGVPPHTGSVRLFEWGEGAWSLHPRVIRGDNCATGGERLTGLGRSVAWFRQEAHRALAVGATGGVGDSQHTGSVWIMNEGAGGRADPPSLVLAPKPRRLEPFDHYGASLACGGEWIYVGSPGHDRAAPEAGALVRFRSKP